MSSASTPEGRGFVSGAPNLPRRSQAALTGFLAPYRDGEGAAQGAKPQGVAAG